MEKSFGCFGFSANENVVVGGGGCLGVCLLGKTGCNLIISSFPLEFPILLGWAFRLFFVFFANLIVRAAFCSLSSTCPTQSLPLEKTCGLHGSRKTEAGPLPSGREKLENPIYKLRREIEAEGRKSRRLRFTRARYSHRSTGKSGGRAAPKTPNEPATLAPGIHSREENLRWELRSYPQKRFIRTINVGQQDKYVVAHSGSSVRCPRKEVAMSRTNLKARQLSFSLRNSSAGIRYVSEIVLLPLTACTVKLVEPMLASTNVL